VASVPNFGHWRARWQLLTRGRAPVTNSLPYEWYDTPNIHLFTFKDFVDLCRREQIVIRKVRLLASTRLGRWLIGCGLANAGAERVIVHIERGRGAEHDEQLDG